MSDRQLIESSLSEYLGTSFSIDSQRALGGGCINDAFRVEGSGKAFFMKANTLKFHDAFATEAAALEEIAATRTIRVPQVIALLKGSSQSYLILEYIETRTSRSGDWQKLGNDLAALHAKAMPYFGWNRDNLIGATPQPNPRSEDWSEFFCTQRIEHQLKLCKKRGYALPQADALLEAVPSFFANYQPFPSLLHGDLWSGNVAFDSNGAPFVFDPGSYYGDREADLAFTEFFGGFSDTFYESYHDALPLDPGYAQRKILYNLYHCLNHLYLFGASYASQAEHMTRQILSH